MAIVGTHAYVNPVVAVALGAILLSEPITPRTIIASVIIIAAVVAMVSGRPQAAEEAGPDPEVAARTPETDGTNRARARPRHDVLVTLRGERSGRSPAY